jgi:hypothetical protein
LTLIGTASSSGRGEEWPHWPPDCDHRQMRPTVDCLLLVIGPSGCGKSSLVRAGLLSVMVLEPDWQTLLPLVPSADPIAALARELSAGQRGCHWLGPSIPYAAG